MATRTVHEISTKVSYEDMANPRRHGRIIGVRHDRRFGLTEYLIQWNDFSIEYASLAGRGWTIG